jgi:hypothetical protein
VLNFRRKLLIGLVLIFLLDISAFQIVNAVSIQSGIKKGDIFIWKCNLCNVEQMNTIFGNTWDNSGVLNGININSKMKWEIDSINYNESTMNIGFFKWNWSSNFTNIGNYSSLKIDLIPAKNFNFTTRLPFIDFIIPIPIRDYLESISFNEWYEIDTRVINMIYLELERNSVESNYPDKFIRIIAEYRDNGIIDSYKITLEDNIVIFDLSLDSIPIYSFPITLFLILGTIIAILLYIIKIRKNKKELPSQ